jgi:LysR family carnitine catabolism transcriptional activator
MQDFSGFLAGRRGRIRIATLPSLAAILLPGVVSAFRGSNPDVELSIEDALSDEVLQRARAGAVDLAVTVVSAVPEPLDDLAVTPVASDRFCCVVPPAHRFARRSTLAWAELVDEPFIAFDATTSIRQHVDASLAAAGVVPLRVVVAACPSCLAWCYPSWASPACSTSSWRDPPRTGERRWCGRGSAPSRPPPPRSWR